MTLYANEFPLFLAVLLHWLVVIQITNGNWWRSRQSATWIKEVKKKKIVEFIRKTVKKLSE